MVACSGAVGSSKSTVLNQAAVGLRAWADDYPESPLSLRTLAFVGIRTDHVERHTVPPSSSDSIYGCQRREYAQHEAKRARFRGTKHHLRAPRHHHDRGGADLASRLPVRRQRGSEQLGAASQPVIKRPQLDVREIRARRVENADPRLLDAGSGRPLPELRPQIRPLVILGAGRRGHTRFCERWRQ